MPLALAASCQVPCESARTRRWRGSDMARAARNRGRCCAALLCCLAYTGYTAACMSCITVRHNGNLPKLSDPHSSDPVCRDEAACGQARQQDAATLLTVVLQQVCLHPHASSYVWARSYKSTRRLIVSGVLACATLDINAAHEWRAHRPTDFAIGLRPWRRNRRWRRRRRRGSRAPPLARRRCCFCSGACARSSRSTRARRRGAV